MTAQRAGRSDLTEVLGALAEQRRSHRLVLSTSADRAARVVREEVVEGRLRSGTRLPEEQLASALGVSRNTLREALSQLVAERILVREAHRGVLVAAPRSGTWPTSTGCVGCSSPRCCASSPRSAARRRGCRLSVLR
ncbi:GntR family transcriptional regulator [Nocardioides mesophilus]|uniref:GntR family transcriptional regulator n=1 Tax=Nocardioides mesophilus TaxID=433659 RepID=UPI001CB7097B|nr:GntR family transcriptional regulator [Nocardioides mesophilus]